MSDKKESETLQSITQAKRDLRRLRKLERDLSSDYSGTRITAGALCGHASGAISDLPPGDRRVRSAECAAAGARRVIGVEVVNRVVAPVVLVVVLLVLVQAIR